MNGDDDPSPGLEDTGVSLLRPYLLTAGRAQPVDHTLEIEAQVLTSRLGAASHPKLTFERREIVSLCRKTMSVAEIAALLGLHIGVARVLVADLAALGYVVVRRPGNHVSHDLGMIERIISGLNAIR
ncbi:DUF742 domain-containing protein [Amycolatopsis sp. NPDC059021]|uniref:DUF742 domain-containing protein n=1 Tax=Amycolatopsis sp. NPDC059021 TaxID=3346704 RepID=UPI00366F9091